MSFRITRTAEDLAQAITALSQRLIKLEERQDVLELRLRQQQLDSHRIPDQELATLDGIDRLLKETRELLQTTEACSEQSLSPLELQPSVGDGGDGEDHVFPEEQRIAEEQPYADEQQYADEQPWQDGHQYQHEHGDDQEMAA